ncbi:MAG: hypothetical protein B7733_04885 [Myxococcales bacterium FL481]|nr:MAG: hypothetical protein B7733_04885 [Myxococcales bacterium FL481]
MPHRTRQKLAHFAIPWLNRPVSLSYFVRHVVIACVWFGLAAEAGATSVAPSAGVSGSTHGARSSARSARGTGFAWPEVVYSGNAVSLVSPLQFGLSGYQPRVRLGVQYDRQWYKRHWLYGGAAALLDRGDYETFRLDQCGLPSDSGACGRGGVAGFDIWGGYAYKLYLRDFHYVVPVLRVGAGYSRWWYPNVGGAREQVRVASQSLTARVGAGVRVFFFPHLAAGLDLNLALGWLGHREQPYVQDVRRVSQLGVGLEVLPLVVEYRF